MLGLFLSWMFKEDKKALLCIDTHMAVYFVN